MALSQQYEGLMLVPWYNREEWELVYELLYMTNDINKRKRAQKIMNLWKHRTPKLPIGVECTSIINNTYLIMESDLNEDLNIVLAASIMRFLNLCCSQNDKQGTFTKQAKSLDFPEWIINIRHDIAHRFSIPSLELLTSALDFCFTWLQFNYWDKQWITLENHVESVTMDYDGIKNALSLYCQIVSLHYLKNKSFNNVEEIETIDPTLMNHIRNFKETFDIKLEMPIDVALSNLFRFIVDNSGEIIDDKQLIDVIVCTICSEGGVLAVKTDYTDFDIDSETELPKNFVRVWKNLIDFVFQICAIQQFLNKLLSIMNSLGVNNSLRKIASLWITHLLQRLLLTKLFIQPNLNENIKKRAFSKFPSMRYMVPFKHDPRHEKIFDSVVELREIIKETPNEYSLLFLDCLLEFCEATPDEIQFTETIQTLVGLNVNDGIEKVSDDVLARCLEDNDKCNPKVDNEYSNLESVDVSKNGSRFELVTDTSIFENCALGLLKHQKEANINPWLIDQSYL